MILGAFGEKGIQHSATNPFFPFFVAESLMSRRRSEYVSYPIGLNYRRAKVLIDAAKDGRYRQVQELLDERLKKTPDVQRWIDQRWDW